VGSLASPIDPVVGVLQDNGGPAFTHALKPGSPAIDKGISNGLATDQRGAPRPFDYAPVANASGGDGSDIGAFESGTPQLSIQADGPNVVLSWPGYYGGFTLQIGSLSPSDTWLNFPRVVGTVGNQYHFTNGPISGNALFRLQGY